MIRLRRALESGRKHPILGPLVLVLLVLLLAMTFLHGASDGHDAAAGLGALCLAVIAILGPLLVDRPLRRVISRAPESYAVRGPPRHLAVASPFDGCRPSATVQFPLRR